MRRAGSRSIVVLLVCVCSFVLAGGSAVRATSATRSQNPDLTVFVSLREEGGGGDGNVNTATTGGSVTVRGSVRNNTSTTQDVLVTATLIEPSDESSSESRRFSIGAGKRLENTFSYAVPDDVEKGTYRYRLAATNANGTSSATARITIY
jgi:hypothetical protein